MSGYEDCSSQKVSGTEEIYNAAVEKLLDSFIVCSTIRNKNGDIVDFLIEYVNDKAAGGENKNLAKCVGINILDLFPYFKTNGLFDAFIEVVETGAPFAKKYIFYEDAGERVAKDGYDIRIVKLDNGFAGTWRQIPSGKIMENEIKIMHTEEELKRLNFIVEFSDDAIIEKNTKGDIINWNKGAERLYGYTAEEMRGKHISILAPRGKELEMEGILGRIRQGLHISHYETIRRRKDGVLLEVSVNVSPVFDLRGRIIGALTVARDVTARKQLEKTLIENGERYRLLIDFLPYGVFVHDGGKIIFVNSYGLKMLGVNSVHDLLGKDLTIFIQKDCSEIINNHKNILDDPEKDIIVSETKMVKADGTLINIEAISTKLSYRDSLSIMTVIKDITAEKKADVLQRRVEENIKKLNEAREYDILKTEFFTNISHELKTPLNIILSSLQLFELLSDKSNESENSKKMEKLTGVMKQNCYRLLRMINNLIDATRIDTGFYKLYLQNCNIVSIVEDVVMSTADYIRNKNIELQFDTNVEEKVIACDPEKIERIILNLLSNAVKFNKKNGAIFVNVYDAGDYIAICVRDNGIGIEKDKLDVIFERFRQVDKSLTRKCEGSGIGLSLVKSLTEMHGGTIEVVSEYGKGSEFTVKLPVRMASDDKVSLDYVQRSIVGDDTGNSETEKISIEFSDIYFNS